MSREVRVSALSPITYARGGPLGGTSSEARLCRLNLTNSTISGDSWCFVIRSRCLISSYGVLSSVSARWPGRGTR
eukprot:1032254-Prymnesium_polylepis.1